MSAHFYERFASYRYVLICHTDVIILEDQLDYWCKKDYDYIGAPWFKDFHRNKSTTFLTVGNGGLSLRKTKSFINVMNSRKVFVGSEKFAQTSIAFGLNTLILLKLSLRLNSIVCARAFFLLFYKRKKYNPEDVFWSVFAKFFIEEFRIPGIKEALGFSIECQPRLCVKQNDGKPPFGIHAWYKYDKKYCRELVSQIEDVGSV